MNKIILPSALLLTLCSGARAAASAGFALDLNRGEAAVLAFSARLKRSQAAALPQDIQAADGNVQTLVQQSLELRQTLMQIRSQTIGAPPVPNPSIRAELDQMAYDFNIFLNNVQFVESQVQSLASSAVKNPQAVAAAQSLQNDALAFNSYAQWLDNEVMMDTPGFISDGYGWEGQQIQMDGLGLPGRAQDLQSLCAQLLAKVR